MLTKDASLAVRGVVVGTPVATFVAETEAGAMAVDGTTAGGAGDEVVTADPGPWTDGTDTGTTEGCVIIVLISSYELELGTDDGAL